MGCLTCKQSVNQGEANVMSITYINTEAMISDAETILNEVLDEKQVLSILMDDINTQMVAIQDAHGGTRHVFTMPKYMALEAQYMEYHQQYITL